MGLFGNLKTDGLEETQDRLGGFKALDTDIYTGEIKVAYAGESTGGAKSLTVIAMFDGKEYRETLWITNKKGENFFMAKDKSGKETGKKSALPGFTVANDLCLCTIEKEINEVDFQEKVLNIYDPEQKKEMPKSVQVAVDLIGKTVSFAILRSLENKTVQQGNEYVPTNETRDVNNIEKVFNTASKFTVVEAREGAQTATFWDAWLEKNKGTVRDKRTNKGEGGTSGSAPQPSGSNGTPRKSLFGN